MLYTCVVTLHRKSIRRLWNAERRRQTDEKTQDPRNSVVFSSLHFLFTSCTPDWVVGKLAAQQCQWVQEKGIKENLLSLVKRPGKDRKLLDNNHFTITKTKENTVAPSHSEAKSQEGSLDLHLRQTESTCTQHPPSARQLEAGKVEMEPRLSSWSISLPPEGGVTGGHMGFSEEALLALLARTVWGTA